MIEYDDREFLAALDSAVEDFKVLAHEGERQRAEKIASAARRLAPRAAVHDPKEPVLADSIEVVEGSDADGPYFDVGTSVPHGLPQEFGTSKMDAHPFMRPAIEEAVR